MFDILRFRDQAGGMLDLLIVDDEPRIRNGLSRFDWSRSGFNLVGSAWSGDAALDLIAAHGAPDVLMTDVRMPGMDGIELARAVRGAHPQCEVIFLSGFADLEFIQAAFEIGAVQYLVKPLDEDELRKALASIQERCAETTTHEPPVPTAEGSRNQTRPATSRARQAVELMRHEFSRASLSLASIAERLETHPNYLSSCIRQEIGTTFSQCLEALRMERAKTLLEDTTLPVHVIAKRVGFNDSRYFSVRFKRSTGMTPRSFRNQK
jgi:two-component system response regulator YesN